MMKKIFIPLLLILFTYSITFSQINVDTRSHQAIDWFDTLFVSCQAISESSGLEGTEMSDEDQEQFYQTFVDPVIQKTYSMIRNDLEKRKMYWEIEDNIWHLDLSEKLIPGLAENYAAALSGSFVLRDLALKAAHKEAERFDLDLLRQIYTLDKYQIQLNYIDANYTDVDQPWKEYKKKFHLLLDEFAASLSDYLAGNREKSTELRSSFENLNELCEQMPVRLPSTPLEPGSFGAFYTKLKYYPDWDKRWRVGQDPDVVVRFQDDVHKFVFWRGTNYIPHWVSEKGFWFNNEFNETWFSEGSAEPMSDKQCRYSHVRIIESNDARVVIHWRYALNDVNYDIAWPDDYTGWGDWSDEYYYIYPDAIGVRKVILHTSYALDNSIKHTDEKGHEWQEGIVVYHPHTRPEEYLHLDAVHVANMKGESGKWSWEKAGEPSTPTPAGSNIVMMNMRSDLKPFIISGEGCKLSAYEGAQGGSHFRWRDHWPTTTEPTPGRNASGKQAAHGSFFHVLNIPYYKTEPDKLTKIMLHGLTRTPVEELVRVASSWLNPPALIVDPASIHISSEGYDQSERAYTITLKGDVQPEKLNLKIQASPESPALNPVIKINNWKGERPSIEIDGTLLKYGSDYTSGIEKTMDNDRCIIWVNKMLNHQARIQVY